MACWDAACQERTLQLRETWAEVLATPGNPVTTTESATATVSPEVRTPQTLETFTGWCVAAAEPRPMNRSPLLQPLSRTNSSGLQAAGAGDRSTAGPEPSLSRPIRTGRSDGPHLLLVRILALGSASRISRTPTVHEPPRDGYANTDEPTPALPIATLSAIAEHLAPTLGYAFSRPGRCQGRPPHCRGRTARTCTRRRRPRRSGPPAATRWAGTRSPLRARRPADPR